MKFEEGNIYFNKIYIVQSIPNEEMQTGTMILDDYISKLAWLDPHLSTELIDINTKAEFFILLSKIKEETKFGKVFPFIHFETHGTKDGIFLKSAETVDFKGFIQIIREINIYSKNNLFISVGACWGGRIQFETNILQPCPYRGFIGPMDEIFPYDLIVSFSSFFDELLRSNDFEKAIDRLNLYNESGVVFNTFNAESVFDKSIEFFKSKSYEGSTINSKFIEDVADQYWKVDFRTRNIYKT